MDVQQQCLYFTGALVVATVDAMQFEEEEESIPRQPRFQSNRGYETVVDCLRSDRVCMETTRMSCSCLRELVEVFRYKYGVDTKYCTLGLEEHLIMTLNYFAHAGSMGRVSTAFGHVKDTMSHVLERMLGPLSQLFVDEVTHVDQSVVHRKFKTTPTRQQFQGCIGALDGTHVHIHPPDKEQIKWRGRNRYPSTNILAICDHDLIFTYFNAGAEGTFHDTRVLDRCRDNPMFNFPHPLPGKYYLCDSGYVNKPGYMTPFRGRRYHPYQFDNGGPQDAEEYFNMIHSGLRSVIERTFGVWKNKWAIVHKGYSLKSFDTEKAMTIIECTAALHNFVRRRMGDISVDEEGEQGRAVSIDLNRTPPPEALMQEGETIDRAKIMADIYQLRFQN